MTKKKREKGSIGTSFDSLLPPDEAEQFVLLKENVDRLMSFVEAQHQNAKYVEKTKISSGLTQAYKNAEQSRGQLTRAMRALAVEVGVHDARNATMIGPMKNLARTMEKIEGQDYESIFDLGRGRILIHDPEKLKVFEKIIGKADKDGHIDAFKSDKLSIKKSKNYLKNFSDYGYGGSWNLAVEIDLGKNRAGKAEIQIIPREYVRYYDDSHWLYEIIRSQEDSVHEMMRTPEQIEVIDALKKANRALFDEAAVRTEFIQYREGASLKDKLQVLSEEEADRVWDILDQMQVSIESIQGKDPGWRTKTVQAMTNAKTSIHNMYRYTKKLNPNSRLNSGPSLDAEH